jgi:predicted protein tyrosine phosphatase
MGNDLFMDIDICSHGVLLGLLSADPGRRDLLLVTNPGVELPEGVPPLARRLLHLQFDDFSSPLPGVVLPTADDVRRALDWAAGRERLVVSCHAGVSRSAALAYLVRCREVPPPEAIGILSKVWHNPNELIIRLGASVLEDDGIYEAYLAWSRERTSAGRARRRKSR